MSLLESWHKPEFRRYIFMSWTPEGREFYFLDGFQVKNVLAQRTQLQTEQIQSSFNIQRLRGFLEARHKPEPGRTCKRYVLPKGRKFYFLNGGQVKIFLA